MEIKSILVWPKSVSLGWSEDSENKSEDNNHSPYAAKCVCETLIREGFGCNEQVFPEGARVEVDGVKVFEWSISEGVILDDVIDESRFRIL